MRRLVTGASGQLGSYLLRECLRRGETVVAWSGRQRGELFGCPLRPVDLADADAVASAFQDARPDEVVHTAALTAVSDCHRDPDHAGQINSRGSAILAELANRAKVPLLFISTDLVFDGEHAPYREEDATAPLSVYGRTKAEAERIVLAHSRNTVVRVPLLFGPSLIGRPTFFDQQVLTLRQGRPLSLFHDEWRTPLSLATAAQALPALHGPLGLLHIGGPQRLSRLEMGQRLAVFLKCDPATLVSVSRQSVAAAEPRPLDVSLDSSRWRSLYPRQDWPTWEEALSELMGAPQDRGNR